MENVNFIINSNPTLFGLMFKDYQNGKVIYSEPSEYAKEEATKDLVLFELRQNEINKRKDICCGDWVLLKNGKKERITVLSTNVIQVGGNQNGSFYIFKSGNCSYSGSCGELIDKTKLKKTGDFLPGLCWIFSGDLTGGGRGVYNILNFKVWEEI
jgi:hypothetical protein